MRLLYRGHAFIKFFEFAVVSCKLGTHGSRALQEVAAKIQVVGETRLGIGDFLHDPGDRGKLYRGFFQRRAVIQFAAHFLGR